MDLIVLSFCQKHITKAYIQKHCAILYFFILTFKFAESKTKFIECVSGINSAMFLEKNTEHFFYLIIEA